MNKKQIVKLFVENPSRMSMGSGKLSKRWNCTPSDIHLARREARAIINTNNSKLSCDKSGSNGETFKVTLKESWFKNMPSQSSPKKSLAVGMHIVSGCWHVPFQNKRMQKGLLQLIEDLGNKVKGFHLIGDVLDVNSLSAHEPNKVPMKGITLGYEYREGNKFLDEFEQVLPKDVEKTFIWGNHENRWTRHVADINISKYADALPSPTEALHLNERGYKVYENWKEDYHFLGKDLQLIHGEFCSKYPARTHVDRMKASVMFAHTHRIDINYDGEKAGFNIGWGGDVNSEAFNYVSRLTKMNWINGFALVHIDEKGNYFTQVIPVFNNEFWYNGKKYE